MSIFLDSHYCIININGVTEGAQLCMIKKAGENDFIFCKSTFSHVIFGEKCYDMYSFGENLI